MEVRGLTSSATLSEVGEGDILAPTPSSVTLASCNGYSTDVKPRASSASNEDKKSFQINSAEREALRRRQ